MTDIQYFYPAITIGGKQDDDKNCQEISGAPPAGAGGSFPKRDIPRLAESIQPPAGAGGFLQRGKEKNPQPIVVDEVDISDN
jgi:hypothetical protein